MNNSVKKWNLILLLFSLITLILWLFVYSLPDGNLRLIACNVGEGDALLISIKETQVLVDGGPNSKVIDCLSKYMPFWDRRLEGVILTHPDKDHMAGIIDVFKRYNVNYFIENNYEVSKTEYQVLKELVGSSGTKVIKAGKDTKLSMGKIYLDILNGTENNFDEKKEITDSQTNDLSLVILLKYLQFEALLTGDAPAGVLQKLVVSERVSKSLNYIKIPHHGSKTGLTQALLELIKPKVAVISVGKNNYGHPAMEIINLLKENKIKVFRTDILGNIKIITNGKVMWLEK